MSDRSTSIGASFKARADSAAFWESWVAGKLSRGGLWVIHHPFTLSTETGRPISSYAESVDLSVHNTVSGVDVEVKSVNLSFDSPESYPHEDVLVCSEKSWNNKWRGKYTVQRDFLLVSRVTGEVVWLSRGVKVWAKPVTDTTRNESYQCMVAHKTGLSSLAAFIVHAQLLEGPGGATGTSNEEANQANGSRQNGGHVHRTDEGGRCHVSGVCPGRGDCQGCCRTPDHGGVGRCQQGHGGEVPGLGNLSLRQDRGSLGPVQAQQGTKPVRPGKAGKKTR